MNTWITYLLRCKDGTLYTGVTTNLDTRVIAHNAGKGAKYTRGRGPVEVVWWQGDLSHSDALMREAQIKKFTRAQKEELCRKDPLCT